MLQTLHEMLDGRPPRMPVFGMNRGTVGFLMNEWRIDQLAERIERQGDPRRAARNARDHGRRRGLHPCGDQRSLAAEGNPPDREDRDFGQRPRRLARACLRRRAGRDPGGLDRLQPLGARPDPAAAGEDAGADADQPVPPAALVGRDPARRHRGLLHDPRGRRTARSRRSPTRPRCATSPGSKSGSTASAR